jgi:hypothetical protein
MHSEYAATIVIRRKHAESPDEDATDNLVRQA